MVQRIQKFTTLAVRQLFICAANQSSFFWNNDKGVVSLDSSCSAIGGCRKPERATPFSFTMLNFFRMRQPEENCVKGNNSTCTATNDLRNGFAPIIEITSDIILNVEIPETKKRLNEMFFDWLSFVEDLDSELVREMVWCYKDLNLLLDRVADLEQYKDYIWDLKFPERKNAKTNIGNAPTPELTLVK